MNRRNSLNLFLRQHGRCLFILCGYLFMVLLLYNRFLRENFAAKSVHTPSINGDEYIISTDSGDEYTYQKSRIRVSNVWVVKDNQHFTNKEYEDLLTSSLRSQHFEPSSQQPADSISDKSSDAIIEGVDDYFTTSDSYSDFTGLNIHQKERVCQLPVHNILFLKTHFTGSDVITNMLNRFADHRELLVALPSDGLSSFYWPSKFDWRYMDMRRLQGNLPHVLSNHARYNPDVMGKFMPYNTRYVTILRNPVHHFMIVFQKLDISERMAIKSSNPFETFVLHPKRYIKDAIREKRFFDSMNLLKNGMFFDLGLHTSDYEQEIAITSAIFDLQKKFSLVLIHEYLDESLVLMKRKFCWEIDDVIYLRSAFARVPPPDITLSLNAREAILKWNKADSMLYDFFNATLWQSILSENNFNSEMTAFKARQKELESYCSGNIKETKHFDLVDLNLTSTTQAKEVCKKMTMSQQDYLDYFRQKYRVNSGSFLL